MCPQVNGLICMGARQLCHVSLCQNLLANNSWYWRPALFVWWLLRQTCSCPSALIGISVLHTTIRILSSTFVHDCCSHSWKYVYFFVFYGQRDRDLDDDQVTSLLSSDRGARGNTAAEMQGQVFGGTRWPCHIRHFLSEVWVAAWVFWGKLFSRFL